MINPSVGGRSVRNELVSNWLPPFPVFREASEGLRALTDLSRACRRPGPQEGARALLGSLQRSADGLPDCRRPRVFVPLSVHCFSSCFSLCFLDLIFPHQASTLAGISMPSALAVFRLITN